MRFRRPIVVLGLLLGLATARADEPPVGKLTFTSKTPVATGGFASLWHTVDETGRSFAVKHIAKGRSLGREVDAYNKLKGHPGLLTLHKQEGNSLVLEWNTGENTHDWKPPTPGAAVDVVRQALAHLEVMHAQGMIHMDVKPKNVMVQPTGP